LAETGEIVGVLVPEDRVDLRMATAADVTFVTRLLFMIGVEFVTSLVVILLLLLFGRPVL
jgi:hypothetical protein